MAMPWNARPAKKAMANTTKDSYSIASTRLPMLGTVAPGESRPPGSIDLGYGFVGAVGAAGAGDGGGRGSVGGLRGVLPNLRRSCSGKRLYSSHCCFKPCFLSGGSFSIFL